MILGVTGLPGSGKSHFCRKFLPFDCCVLDADHIGHLVLRQREVVLLLTSCFGDSIMIDGVIHRASLGKIAFEQGKVSELNKIVHPVIIAEIDRLCEKALLFKRPVLLEAAILWESGLG